MSEALKLRELKDGDIVQFIPRTEQYGRAEFVICPAFKRGRLTGVWIYPAQQKEATEYFHIAVNYKPDDFSVSSWEYKGFPVPKIWLMFWCKEHKCMGFRVYPPNGTNSFRVETLSNLSIKFDAAAQQPESERRAV